MQLLHLAMRITLQAHSETKELAQAVKAHGVDQVGSYVHQFVRSDHEETLDTGSLLRCLEKLISAS